jgi:hypothetical protein
LKDIDVGAIAVESSTPGVVKKEISENKEEESEKLKQK